MRKTLLLLHVGLVMIANPTFSDIYKWTDPNGDVHFSDKPHTGAETVNLPPVQIYSPPSADSPDSGQPATQALPEVGYDTLEIGQPQDQATVRDNSGNMSIQIKINPKLKPHDALVLIFDDSQVGVPQASPIFTLSDVERGSHTIQVKVLNQDGIVIQSSKPVTFYMHRNQANRINRGG